MWPMANHIWDSMAGRRCIGSLVIAKYDLDYVERKTELLERFALFSSLNLGLGLIGSIDNISWSKIY